MAYKSCFNCHGRGYHSYSRPNPDHNPWMPTLTEQKPCGMCGGTGRLYEADPVTVPPRPSRSTPRQRAAAQAHAPAAPPTPAAPLTPEQADRKIADIVCIGLFLGGLYLMVFHVEAANWVRFAVPAGVTVVARLALHRYPKAARVVRYLFAIGFVVLGLVGAYLAYSSLQAP